MYIAYLLIGSFIVAAMLLLYTIRKINKGDDEAATIFSVITVAYLIFIYFMLWRPYYVL